MELKKKLAVGLASGALLLQALAPAAAFAGDAYNDTTGANSKNEAEVEVKEKTEIVQDNYADIFNFVMISTNTGGNEANKNTGSASVETGDAEIEIGVENTANSNFASISSSCCGDYSASNEKTGAYSENEAEVEIESKVEVDQYNDAIITNKVMASTNTGDNEANKNTGDASVETGDSETVVALTNAANENIAMVQSGGDNGGDPSASNNTTGANSSNEAEVEIKKKVEIMQTNFADIFNSIKVRANTGENEANKNTGEGSVETGDADLALGVSNMANSNAALVEDACDTCDDYSAGNEKTGADSENEAEVEVEDKDEIEQFNGYCVGNQSAGGLFGFGFGGLCFKPKCGNFIMADLNTGENKTNKNTADDVDSGDVDATVVLSTEVNQNVAEHGDGDGLSLPDDWDDLLDWLEDLLSSLLNIHIEIGL